jgi:NADH pyrophosphatase NudC (nudix superfamily)
MGIKTVISYETVKTCPNQKQHTKELIAKLKAQPNNLRLTSSFEDFARTNNFCNKCGEKYVNKRIRHKNIVCCKCNQCVYPNGDTYCPNCGSKL